MTTPWSQEYAWAFYAAACILWLFAGIGLYIALFRDRSRGRRRCPKCWYDMAGVPGLKCPECGREARKERRLHTTRRRWRLATLFALLAALGVAPFRAPHVFRNGPWTILPTPILNIVLYLWEDEARVLYESSVPGMSSFGYSPPGQPTAWHDLLLAWYAARELDQQPIVESDSRAVWVIADLGIHGQIAIPALERAGLRGSNEAVNALVRLAGCGVIEAWAPLDDIAINSSRRGARFAAFQVVRTPRPEIGNRSSFLRQCVQSSPDPDIRGDAAFDLAKNGEYSRREVLRHLASSDDWIRTAIIEGQSHHADDCRWLIPELQAGLARDETRELRRACAKYARTFTPLDSGWHTPLIELLQDDDSEIRILAAQLSLCLDTVPTPVADKMAQLLKDEKHVAECVSEAMISRSEVWTGDQMRAACSVLAAQDSRSIDLIVDRLPAETWAVLLDHAGSQQSRLHRSIYHFVMERTDDDPVRIGLVLQLLKECDDPKARAEGASMLGRANASHVTITPALVHAGLHDPDRSVRAVALRAAENRRDADPELVAALIEALNDPSREVVLAAANSLARLGPRAAAANEALVAAADHPDASARDAIADAIRKTKPAGAP